MTQHAQVHDQWRRLGAAAAAVALAGALAACGSTTATTTTTTSTTAPSPPATLGHYVALFPFSTAADVSTWEAQYASSGTAGWHRSAQQTAVQFAAWLGFTQVNTALAARLTSLDAHVTVGFRIAGTANGVVRSAVVHLVRWGTGSNAPWEVVGTDDTTLSLTTPAYGAAVSSPTTVGGKITGVDENIKVRARTLSTSADVGTSCCSAAGGTGSPWSRSLTFTAPAGAVVTIIAQTGGHVAAVERFAVTGVRAG